MAKLIYVANVSLDGYIEDAHGGLEWTEPTDEVFAFITDLVRPVGTYLYGRRMYETMAVWETDPTLSAQSELRVDFADVWRSADKIVYSTTLQTVSTAETRLERHFDPDAVHDLKTCAASDLTVGGPRAEFAWRIFPFGCASAAHPSVLSLDALSAANAPRSAWRRRTRRPARGAHASQPSMIVSRNTRLPTVSSWISTAA